MAENVVQPVPFRVNRTKSSNLPVYLNYTSGRTRIITVVRKIDGDVVVRTACDFTLSVPRADLGFEKEGRGQPQ